MFRVKSPVRVFYNYTHAIKRDAQTLHGIISPRNRIVFCEYFVQRTCLLCLVTNSISSPSLVGVSNI